MNSSLLNLTKHMVFNVTRDSLKIWVINKNNNDVFIPIIDIVESFIQIIGNTTRLYVRTLFRDYIIYNDYVALKALNSVIYSYLDSKI